MHRFETKALHWGYAPDSSGGRAIGTEVRAHCDIQNTIVKGAAQIGPYARLRPGTVLADNCKVGDFVEVKNSVVGRGTKLPHFSYVGDADIGKNVNVGCGVVFANYDGCHKYRTEIGDGAFIGCQTNLVAPVRVGDGAYTAAGSAA